jgi:hypothetical protein
VRVLIDECLPRQLHGLLAGDHRTATVADCGWAAARFECGGDGALEGVGIVAGRMCASITPYPSPPQLLLRSETIA